MCLKLTTRFPATRGVAERPMQYKVQASAIWVSASPIHIVRLYQILTHYLCYKQGMKCMGKCDNYYPLSSLSSAIFGLLYLRILLLLSFNDVAVFAVTIIIEDPTMCLLCTLP